ncbi:MAG: glycosyltransferase family 39 protein [Anaerolineae bacterium]|nr:glycosyltransferase family 39 protein [Anaerolineae bacterium]
MDSRDGGPSPWGWAFLLVALALAALLRFWQVDQWPPGFYRDEAFNGLDALGVLDGQHALFFAANNGREPAHIYLTAAAVALFGRSVFAVRLAAALAGTATTLVTYWLARSWFGWRTGVIAAWLWAVTLWPVHLSRIGLRPILLVPLLALAFWLGTRAYRRNSPRLWLAAGAAYGATFYTYLAARFTPILLLLLLSYLFLNRPQQRRRLLRGVLWGGAGALVILLPLAVLAWQQPQLILGRTGQVSLFSESVNQGDLWGTLWRHTWRTLGLFLWQGDTIARHNPPGRPLFDWLLAVPFLAGLLWSLRHWRRPAAAALLLWVAVMLGPTLFAEDAPHFLRAVAILPAALFLPALGLSKLWDWPKLAGALRHGLVLFLAVGTLIVTVVDYRAYLRAPETGYLFEAGARELAQEVNRYARPLGTNVYLDRRFWQSWPSLRFLVEEDTVWLFTPETALPQQLPLQAAIFAWPYGPLDFVPEAVAGSEAGLVFGERGPLVRGDLEPEPYPLYYAYLLLEAPPGLPERVARFGEDIILRDARLTRPDPGTLQVDLIWQGTPPQDVPLVVFVHVLDTGRVIGQDDTPPLQGVWAPTWWQPDLLLHDRHLVSLTVPFDAAQHQVVVGLYDSRTVTRLPVYDAADNPAGDSWPLQLHKEN